MEGSRSSPSLAGSLPRAAAPLAVLLSCAAAAHALQQPTMFRAPKFLAGDGAFSTAMADVDGDGLLDVVVGNELDDSLALLLGRGDGTLEEPAFLPAGDAPQGLVAADFDADGTLDLAVANHDSDDVVVLLGAGGGTFGAPIFAPAGDGPRPLAAADMNGDGALDLVVGLQTANSTSVLLGLGDGSFTVATTVVSGREPSDIAIADLDADALLDVVVANEGDDDVSVLRGLGGGALAAPVKYAADNEPSAVALSDLDGDGSHDLAITCGMLAVQSLQVRYGVGDGNFGPADLFPGAWNRDVVAADMDADGDPDLLLAEWGGFVRVGRNDGGHEFSTAQVVPAGREPRNLSVGDLDGDDLLDVVAAHGDFGDDVVVLRGLGAGQLDSSPTTTVGGYYPIDMQLVDTDGDGAGDVVTTNSYSDNVSVLRGLGDGSFAAPILSPSGQHPTVLSSGDVDGDGIVDLGLVAYSDDQVQVRIGAGDGTFVPGQNLSVTDPVSCALVDLDADGDLDLAAVSRLKDKVWLYANAGTGQFSGLGSKAVGDQPAGIDAGDLDGDGLTDVAVVASLSYAVAVLMGVGGGLLADAVLLPTGFGSDVHVVDVDEDGALDLAVHAYGLVIHWGGGDGSFAAETTTYDQGGTSGLVLGDMDGDGVRDLVLADGSDQHVSVFPGLGGGVFGAPRRFVVYRYSSSLAAGDFDGDQALDLVVTGGLLDGVMTVLLNEATLPWLDVGGALAGAAGPPELSGTGSLAAGTQVAVTLSEAAASSLSALVAGLSAVQAPLKGGVLVPSPDLVLSGLPTGAFGGYTLAGAWPAGLPSGLELYLQAWISDAAGPAGYAASNALLATTP